MKLPEDNPQAWKKLYKKVVCAKDGRCSRCPWHSGENLKNYRRHGVKKPRGKK